MVVCGGAILPAKAGRSGHGEAAARCGRTAVRAAALSLALLGACAAPEADGPAPLAYETGAGSCPGQLDPRFDRALRPDSLDPALIDRAIRSYTNRERCKSGLAPLSPSPALARAAAMHAADMAAASRVAPVLPDQPERTLSQRYAQAGVGRYEQRGENLMRIALERPGVARVRSAAPECAFPIAGPDRALGPTYGSIARRLVDAWMRSAAMRTKMLSPDWTHMGAGLAVSATEAGCGDVYAAQSFVKA